MYIFLVLWLTSSMCCTSAADERNQGLIGGETEQNPNNPKYQNMVEDIVFQQMSLRQEDIREIIVSKVTTQDVDETITRIKFRIFLNSGKRKFCDSEISKNVLRDALFMSYTCRENENPSVVKRLKKENEDPSISKRLEFAKSSAIKYIQNLPGNLVVVETKIKNYQIKSIMFTIGILQIMYVNLDVIVSDTRSRHFICSVVYDMVFVIVSNVECIENLNKNGGYYWVDPFNNKYRDFAERSLQVSKQRYKWAADYHIVVVTFVKQQVVAGFKDVVDFIVLKEDSTQYTCQSLVWERSKGKAIIEDDIKCNLKDLQSNNGADLPSGWMGD